MVSRVSSTWSLTRTVDLPGSAVRQPADGLAGHCAHVQSGRHPPVAQARAAVPSQSSPTSRTPLPQTGAGASTQVGPAKRNRAMRVLHRPLAGTYSLVYQKVQSSTGSRLIEL